MNELKSFENLHHAYCLYEEIAPDTKNTHSVFMSCAMHSHNYNEICIVTQGDSKIITNKTIRRRSGKFIIFYPAYMPHMQINDLSCGYKRYLIRYENNVVNNSLLSPIAQSFISCVTDVLTVPIDGCSADLLMGAVSLLHSLSTDKKLREDYYSRNLTLAVILNIISQAVYADGKLELNSGKFFYIAEVLNFISTNYADKINADDLAKRFFVSRAKLMNDFKRITGETLSNYITQIRLEHATALLSIGESLSSISEKCGFSSVSYFINRFSKQYGTTPAKYDPSTQDYGFEKHH